MEFLELCLALCLLKIRKHFFQFLSLAEAGGLLAGWDEAWFWGQAVVDGWAAHSALEPGGEPSIVKRDARDKVTSENKASFLSRYRL